MLASSANQEGQANHARKLYGIPYESEFNAAGISRGFLIDTHRPPIR
jgi:hypothetical protein